jgi:phage terminase large subunit-like protein
VPRKFSKTTSVCAFAIYDFLFGDDNAQAYTGANSYDQAKICFDEISRVLHGLDPGWTKFKATRELIKWREGRNSSIRCLSNSPDKLDGLNASTVIMDEYAQADSADLRNVLTTSMGMRANPLLITITTASDKQTAPFIQELEHEQGVLLNEVMEGYAPDDTSFAHIFTPDCDDDESDPATWAKVQPHLGITVLPDFYEQQWGEAQKSIENMKAFRTKMLNIFVTGNDRSWIEGSTIREHSRLLDIDTLGYRADCEVAVDLSVDNDFSAVSYYIWLNGEKHHHIHTDYYFPEGRMAKHPNREVYQRWVDGGHLRLCKGNIISYEQIVGDILAHGKNLRILKIAYDPNKAAEFTNLLINCGGSAFLYPYKQTYFYFTKPCMAIVRMLEESALTFNENPINNYCFDNCILDRDNMDNCKPLKRSDNRKIDGAITALMALGVSLEQRRC